MGKNSVDELGKVNAKVPDQIYVGTQKCRKFNTEDSPLAYSIPVGTDKEFEKRKESVHQWSGVPSKWDPEKGGYKLNVDDLTSDQQAPSIIDNVPVTGHSFSHTSSRYTTSNKWINVVDPRGFMLQITPDNLLEVIRNCTIVNGVVETPCVWGRAGSNVYLLRVTHPAFIAKTEGRTEVNDLEIGSIYMIGQRDSAHYVYLGEYYLAEVHGTRASALVKNLKNGEIGDIVKKDKVNYYMNRRTSDTEDGILWTTSSRRKAFVFRSIDGTINTYASKPKNATFVDKTDNTSRLDPGTALAYGPNLKFGFVLHAELWDTQEEAAEAVKRFDTDFVANADSYWSKYSKFIARLDPALTVERVERIIERSGPADDYYYNNRDLALIEKIEYSDPKVMGK